MQGPERAAPTIQLPEVSGSKAQRRLTRRIAPVLQRILRPSERSLVVVEAVRVAPLRRRLQMGAGWPFLHRVALVFTDRRLLEVSLRMGAAKRTAGDVREIEWKRSEMPFFDGTSMRIGEHRRWWLRDKVAPEVKREIRKAATEATPGARRVSEVQEWRLCTGCGATMQDRDSSCHRCGAKRPSPRLAGFLMLAIPGGGLLYLGRRGSALLRMATELGLWVAISWWLLHSDQLASQILAAVVGAVFLALVKIESVGLARRLSVRAGAVENGQGAARWKMWGLGGLVFSSILLILPLLFAGSMSTEITGDLATRASYLGWTVERHSVVWRHHEEGMRALWTHSSGLEVRATARPLGAFTSPRRARLHWVEDHEQGPGVVVERLELGSRRVLRISEMVQASGTPTRVNLRYLIMDDEGRDEHQLAAAVAPGEMDGASEIIEKLIPCLHWIPAVDVDGIES